MKQVGFETIPLLIGDIIIAKAGNFTRLRELTNHRERELKPDDRYQAENKLHLLDTATSRPMNHTKNCVDDSARNEMYHLGKEPENCEYAKGDWLGQLRTTSEQTKPPEVTVFQIYSSIFMVEYHEYQIHVKDNWSIRKAVFRIQLLSPDHCSVEAKR